MVKLNKIYTRTGDDATTGLVRGPRRKKNDVRIAAYGSVDETNSFIGLARCHTGKMAKLDAALARIQNDLFDVGADLATPGPDKQGDDNPPLRITQAQVDWLESEIDRVNEALDPLKSFVLPGGTPLAAALHVARAVSRRAERDIARLMQMEKLENLPLVYLNRLSDLLFVFARMANDNGKKDVLWDPGRFSSSNKD
ncbi:MAG: cob(I)yrinic acid a,c-diamide adenosyltransferase [Hyphomicrobiaceae bacterium]|nr:cob(I)yrinic acid a,c-diamide adenosyltransferase [Hyphomicrobiaceae bacterium]MCC0023699.1 cob(I)yrinic acid a,c-diamide adenosyltransferase [Hyphomicrobiaceae bacterium]